MGRDTYVINSITKLHSWRFITLLMHCGMTGLKLGSPQYQAKLRSLVLQESREYLKEGNLKNDVSPMFFNKLLRTVAYVCFMNVRAKWKRATSPSFKPKKQGLHRSFLPPVVKMHGSSGWMPQKWPWLAPKIVFASLDTRTSLCFQNRPPQSLSQGGQGLTHEVGLLPGVIWGWLLGLGPAIFCYHYIQVSFN